MSNIYDIRCQRGVTLTLTLGVKDSAGNPVNYSQYNARMQVRKTYDTPTTLVDLSSAAGAPPAGGTGITITGSQGQIVISLAAADSLNLPCGNWVYDLNLIAPDGEITRLIEGKFVVSNSVTRS